MREQSRDRSVPRNANLSNNPSLLLKEDDTLSLSSLQSIQSYVPNSNFRKISADSVSPTAAAGDLLAATSRAAAAKLRLELLRQKRNQVHSTRTPHTAHHVMCLA